jgi:histidine ammonia-lyase
LGSGRVTIEDVVDVSRGSALPVIDDDEEVRSRIARSAGMVQAAIDDGRVVYGVTTGYGASATFGVDSEIAHEMPLNLLRYHGCGTGEPFTEAESAAIVTVRAASLARGYSGVRLALVERLCELVQLGILPVIPQEGSVGASGDLTPLSYVAAVLVGEREVWRGGAQVAAADALAALGLEPLALRAKEGLAVLNGTSVMTAIACLAWDRALRLARLACTATAMVSDVLDGEPGHFTDRIFELKPHPGQRVAARWIRETLGKESDEEAARVQDPYSIRCAPHVIGVLLDALPFTRTLIETEANGVNDNPLIDPDQGRYLHGGNFYGGHSCLATDTLKNVVANVADLLDRQLSLLCNPATNHGLPANLVARTGYDRYAHHGFKAMEITASALTAEALKMAGPTSVFSRSTESHNQDKVSMGTISAREALRILDLTETVAAVHLLAVVQAVDLRGPEAVSHAARTVWEAVRAEVPKNEADRRMDGDIRAVLAMHARGDLPVGSMDWGAM